MMQKSPSTKYNKYGAKAITVDGRRFASHREAARYATLHTMQALGHIVDLRCQVRFPLVVNDMPICTYVADFEYRDLATGRTVVEDAKGVRTPLYNVKRKLMQAVYGVTITEV